jgi:exodeoxyribonuclease VII large subunit
MNNTPTRLVHSVTELNQMVRSLLEDALPLLWVEGEISNFMRPSSGHWYFSLKDSNAQIRCAMFQRQNKTLNFQPENGAKVLLRGKISLYEPRGDFQMIADFMEEAGDGALRRAFELLKLRLAAEGLFESAKKKVLPKIPKTIGVVTSPTGAAIRDIISVLKRRFPGITIIIYPTLVQGNSAAPQIVEALSVANTRKECEVIILARGGGSLEDLWPFNEEIVARAIFSSELPVISAVGHEIDFTIADFVADHRAPTPSAAAELVSPDRIEELQHLARIYTALTRQIKNKLNESRTRFEELLKRLQHPGQRLRDQSQRLDELDQRLQRAMLQKINHYQHQLTGLVRSLDAISPLATLARGYAIVSSEKTGEIIYRANQIENGEKIIAKLSEGNLKCLVEERFSS